MPVLHETVSTLDVGQLYELFAYTLQNCLREGNEPVTSLLVFGDCP